MTNSAGSDDTPIVEDGTRDELPDLMENRARIARRVQGISLGLAVILTPLFMGRFLATYRTEIEKRLPDASAGNQDLGVGSAWVVGSICNIVAIVFFVLAIASLGAFALRAAGSRSETVHLRHTIGAVLASYIVLRLVAWLIASLAGVPDRVVLQGFTAPEPSLLLPVVALILILRKAETISLPRLTAAAAVPSVALGIVLSFS